MNVIIDFIETINWESLFNIIAGLIALAIGYLQIIPLLPRSSNKIKSDIDLMKKAEDAGIDNFALIRDSIERSIQKNYSKSLRINSYPTLLLGLVPLIGIGYLLYQRIMINDINTSFFILLFIAFFFFVITLMAFDRSKEASSNDKLKVKKRTPVFKFILYSWNELIMGMAFSLIFLYWTYQRLYVSGTFRFEGWSLLTFICAISGIMLISKAFKEKAEVLKKEENKGSAKET